jgi:hypothetical protein
MTTEQWLRDTLRRVGARAGTVHLLRDDALVLAAAHAIPEAVLDAVRTVPPGKGMAGLCLVERKPVATCDLRTDDTGRVRPGARAVDARTAVALPVFDAQGRVRAVVGFAFADDEGIDAAREAALLAQAATLP